MSTVERLHASRQRPPFAYELMHALLQPYASLDANDRMLVDDIKSGQEVVAAAFSRQHYAMTLIIPNTNGRKDELYGGAEYLTPPKHGGILPVRRLPYPFGSVLFGPYLDAVCAYGTLIEIPHEEENARQLGTPVVRHQLYYDGRLNRFILNGFSGSPRLRHVQKT